MLRSENFYSRFVIWAKIILPVIALALLSSLFLFSKKKSPETGITFTQVDLKEMAQQEKLSQPKISGVTKDGASILLTAEEIGMRNDLRQQIDLEDVRATIGLQDGTSVEMLSTQGLADISAQTAHFFGGVEGALSTGFQFVADSLELNLEKIHAQANEGIRVIGPNFHLESGSMEISAAGKLSAGKTQKYVLDFNNGVKMIYTPKQ